MILFILCFFHLPYGYYQLERFLVMIGFTILAYRSHEEGDNNEAIIYGCLALLFQPLIKIALGRQIWNIVNIVIIIGLVITILWQPKHV
jgi:hypothetical protein